MVSKWLVVYDYPEEFKFNEHDSLADALEEMIELVRYWLTDIAEDIFTSDELDRVQKRVAFKSSFKIADKLELKRIAELLEDEFGIHADVVFALVFHGDESYDVIALALVEKP